MVVVIEIENKQEEVELTEFNLEKALNGAKVFTRDGRQVVELHQFKTKRGTRTVVGVIDGCLYEWYEDGVFYGDGKTNNDLFILPEVVCKYQNMYYDSKDNRMWTGGKLYNTKQEALSSVGQSNYYIKTIKITHEID
jgi:hypothetical protein